VDKEEKKKKIEKKLQKKHEELKKKQTEEGKKNNELINKKIETPWNKHTADNSVNSLNPELSLAYAPDRTPPLYFPTIVPAYERSVLESYLVKGNPFAKALLATGLTGEDNEKMYFPFGEKPYEQIWFYKDPQGAVQGPFSCIEMFNWTMRDCFPADLLISFWDTEFVPMNRYMAEPMKRKEDERKEIKLGSTHDENLSKSNLD
jgi:hypothetical protein